MYGSYGDPTGYGTTEADPTFIIIAVVIGLIIAIIGYVIMSIFMAMIFKKADIESWKAWVPVYNQWVFLELGEQQGWLALLPLTYLIPFLGLIVGPIASLVTFVFSCMAAHKIGLNFGKESVFVLLYVFLTIVWIIWIAVDKTAVWKPFKATHSASHSESVPPSHPAAM